MHNLVKQNAVSELVRLEEDCEHSFKAHHNAEGFWDDIHMVFGLGITVLTAGAALISAREPVFSGALAGIAALLSAIVTFWKPDKRASSHKVAGHQLHAVRNKSRQLRTIEVELLSDDEFARRVIELADRRDELNASSPTIPRWAYEKAKKDIDEGRASYAVDSAK